MLEYFIMSSDKNSKVYEDFSYTWKYGWLRDACLVSEEINVDTVDVFNTLLRGLCFSSIFEIFRSLQTHRYL